MYRIVLAPRFKGDSFIIGQNGSLRVIDAKKGCRGFATGCQCRSCREREARSRRKAAHHDALPVNRCRCERPLRNGMTCDKCGKPISSKQAA